MTSYHPHNIPLVFLGAAVLWFGWFGFNAGSALGANGLAVHAFITTNTSAATALLSWMLVERMFRGRPTLLGAATGAVVGLVAITPAAGFVPVWASLVIGGLVSPICYFALGYLKVKARLRRRTRCFRMPRSRRDLGRHCHRPVHPEIHQSGRAVERTGLRRYAAVSRSAVQHSGNNHAGCSRYRNYPGSYQTGHGTESSRDRRGGRPRYFGT